MNAKTNKLFTATLAAGALGFFLRLLLYRVGFDDKNILSSSHPLHLACLALTVGLGVYLTPVIWKPRKDNERKANSPGQPLRALGCFAAGCVMAFHGVALAKDAQSLLDTIRTAMALISSACMVLCFLVPGSLKQLHNICHGFICAFFALDLLCRYQDWSGNPQLPDYIFQVFACVLLSLASYHRLAFGTGLGKPKALLWCSLMAAYLSLLCAAGPETRSFYLSGAIWAAACMDTAEAPAEQKEENP